MGPSTLQEEQQPLFSNKTANDDFTISHVPFFREVGRRLALSVHALSNPSTGAPGDDGIELASLTQAEDDRGKPYSLQQPMTYSSPSKVSEMKEAMYNGFEDVWISVYNTAFDLTSRKNRRAAWDQAFDKTLEVFHGKDEDTYVCCGGHFCASLAKTFSVLTDPCVPGPDTCGLKPIPTRSERNKVADPPSCEASGADGEEERSE